MNVWNSWQPPRKIITKKDVGIAVNIEKSCELDFPLTEAEIFTLTIGCYGMGGEAAGMLLERIDDAADDQLVADSFFIYWTPNGRTGRFYYQKMREDDLYLVHLAVRKQFWRTGIGSFAVNWLKEELVRLRYLSRIVIDIRERDKLGLSFLIKNDFKGQGIVYGAFPQFPKGQRDAYRLIWQPGRQTANGLVLREREDCQKGKRAPSALLEIS